MLCEAVRFNVHLILILMKGHTKSHKANFPDINHPDDDADPKGGKSLNNTKHGRQRL
jgi:hypothetical protein